MLKKQIQMFKKATYKILKRYKTIYSIERTSIYTYIAFGYIGVFFF